jgi:hypothetical protein
VPITSLLALSLLAADPPAPGGVTMNFAWPSPLRCEVEDVTRATLGGGPTPKAPVGNTVRLALEAVHRGDGWLVRQRVVGTKSDPPQRDAKKADLREMEVLLYPPFTVSNDGSFRGLELTAADRAIVDARQEKSRQTAEFARKLNPGLRMAPEDVLGETTKKAASNWNFLVGAWAGKQVAEGEGPALRSVRAMPGKGPIPVVDRMRLTRGAPCDRPPRDGCVALDVTTDPDAEGPSSLRYHAVTTLVTDPRTLVPRSLTRLMDGTDHLVETTTYRCRR